MRATEPGYIRIGIICTMGRRAMWVRFNGDGAGRDGDSIEMCAGREGDDAYVKIDRSHPLFGEIADVLSAAEFAATCPRCGGQPLGLDPFAFRGDDTDHCSSCPPDGDGV